MFCDVWWVYDVFYFVMLFIGLVVLIGLLLVGAWLVFLCKDLVCIVFLVWWGLFGV